MTAERLDKSLFTKTGFDPVQSVKSLWDRLFPESPKTYYLWQGNRAGAIDVTFVTLHDSIRDAEQAISRHCALIMPGSPTPPKQSDPMQFPIRVYEDGIWVETLNYPHQLMRWVRGLDARDLVVDDTNIK